MALNDQVKTWVAYGRESGLPVVVDDQTFNEKDHVMTPPGEVEDAPAEKKRKAKV